MNTNLTGLALFNDIVNTLQQTNSATEKVKILKQYANNPEVCNYFRYAYDPYKLYGVTSKSLKKTDIAELTFYDSIFELLDQLNNRVYTGKRAIAIVNGFISQNAQYEELLYNFFDRNLKIGMGEKQLNKALNNIIPVFDVALANIFEEDRADKYGLDQYIIETKMNGVRLVTIIRYYSDDNIEITSYSRKGKVFTTCQKINDELLKYYKTSKYFGQSVVFDGEACIIDKDGKEDWNQIVSEIKRKNHTMVSPMYKIFDFMTLDEFSGLKQSRDYTFRRDQLFRNFFGLDNITKFTYLSIVFATPYTKSRFDRLIRDFVETEKWEGLILRKDCAYKSGRSNDLLKVKLFKDAEYRVVDVEVSTKPILVNGIMVETPCVGSIVVKLENGCECKVGSGFSDQQRIDWYNDPQQIIGKQILVKYKELTKNKDNTWSLLFPTLLHVYDTDRDF